MPKALARRVRLSERALCDLELLATGAFSPLDRFMGSADYSRVARRNAAGQRASVSRFPSRCQSLPMSQSHSISEVALLDSRNEIVATMIVEEIYEWDLGETAHHVFGTNDERHPLVAEMHRWGKRNISGRLKVLRLPVHFDFRELRLTPAQTRNRLEASGLRTSLLFKPGTLCIARMKR